jgi:hypothetical protein
MKFTLKSWTSALCALLLIGAGHAQTLPFTPDALPGVYLYANLPTNNLIYGTPAHTSDQGLVYWNGIAWGPTPAPAIPPGTLVPVASGGVPTIPVTANGLRCDGQVISGVTTTAGSAVVTSTAYNFNAIDALRGKYITIPGAGASGGPLNATISSVQGGAATLSTTATAAVAGTVTITIANPAVVSFTNSFIAGQPVVFNTTGALPTGITAGTVYYVISAGLSGSAFEISVIQNGGGLATSGTQSGTQSISGLATFGTADDAAMTTLVANTASAGGGRLELPTGMCVMTAPVLWGSNVSLTGQGWGKSIIKWISTSDQTLGVFYSALGASGTNTSCNAAYASQNDSNIQFRDFEVDGAAATDATYAISAKAFLVSCATNTVYDHLYMHDFPATCLGSDYQFGGSITNNIAANCGRLVSLSATDQGGSGIGIGVLGLTGESYVISGNTVTNPGHYGISIESESGTGTVGINAVVSNNVIAGGPNSQQVKGQPSCGIDAGAVQGVILASNGVYGSSNAAQWNGVCADAATTQTNASVRTLIANNFVTGTLSGIVINYAGALPSGTGTASLLVQGNEIYGAGQYGVELLNNATTTGHMDSVSINNNVIRGVGQCGIGLIASANIAATNIQINNNLVWNGGVGASTYKQAAICSNINVTGLDIKGNRAYDNGTSTQKYFLGVNTGVTLAGVDIQGNNATGTVTSFLDNLGTITGQIINNKGYNPVGTSAVSVTASPFTYTAGLSPTTLYINTIGGVSTITKNGTGLPLTVNTIAMAPNDTVIFTYTVTAPTMTADVN